MQALKKLVRVIIFSGLSLILADTSIKAQEKTEHLSDSIRLDQIGFYPKAHKTAVVLIAKPVNFTIRSANGKVVFTGSLKPAPQPDLSGAMICRADFTALQTPGEYTLEIPERGYRYPFTIRANVHRQVADGAIKAFYYQRASIALEAKYAGKWSRPLGHPDDKVLIHPSAATASRPAGTVISSSKGWYDAGDYNKYIVNSGISMGTLLSLYEDHPAYIKNQRLNIPESGDQVPDLLNEILWNLRWMLTMQDPADGGVYHKLTNAAFDGMIMPDKTTAPRYVVKRSTAAALDLAAVTAQASRIFKGFDKQLPGLADSCLKASVRAWQWAMANPNIPYDQKGMNASFKPAVTTGTYDDRQFDDEFSWAASELYVTTQDDRYLQNLHFDHIRYYIPSWARVGTLGYYTLLRNQDKLTQNGRKYLPALQKGLLAFADSLLRGAGNTAYGTVMGTSPRDFIWGSNAVAANQGIALLQAYRLTHQKEYIDGAITNLDYLLGRNGTGYCYVTGFGYKPVMHPHHRPSVADGILQPVPGLLAGGPNPGRQDGVALPSLVANQAYTDDDRAYAVNEIAINWNAPFAYLVNAIEALQH